MATEIALPKPRNDRTDRRTWHGLAFIMEALVLLVFLVISMAVLMQVFAAARTHGQSADDLSQAVIIASNQAEYFNADPTAEIVAYYKLTDGVLAETDEADENVYTATTTITEEKTGAGTMYSAHIEVEHAHTVVYEIDTARYVTDAR